MKIYFDKLRLQNFYSYGDEQELDFNKFTSNVILIDGIDKDTEGSKIGSGKSSLIAAITYALFGETPSNVKANEIVNYIRCKDAKVELEFFITKTRFKIIRGRKPKMLGIYRARQNDSDECSLDWEDISKTDDRDNDLEIIRLVGMDFETFLQTSLFSVGSENNKPFLNMTPTHQKKVLENIFNFDIHNTQLGLVKDKLRDEHVKLVNLETSIKEVKFANDKINEQLVRLTHSHDTFELRRQRDIKTLTDKINFYKNIDIDSEKEKYDCVAELETHKTIIQNKIIELKSSGKDVKNQINSETRELEILSETYTKEIEINASLNNNVCPTCTQSWCDSNAIKNSDNLLHKMKTQMLSIDKSLDNFEKSEKQINDAIKDNRALLTEISEALDQINISIKKKELDNLDLVITNLKKELEQVITQENHFMSEIEANKNLLRVVDYGDIDIISENINDYKLFVKISEDPKNRGKFLRRYIRQSNDILRGFKKLIPDYNIHIQFNPDFSIRVMKLGKEVNPGSLSNGEKRIGNIMIMLALMQVFKLKNNVEFNAMFMDEVLDSGINGSLLESVYTFIVNVCHQEKVKLFLISHREEIKEKVKETIMVTKTRGISKLEFFKS